MPEFHTRKRVVLYKYPWTLSTWEKPGAPGPGEFTGRICPVGPFGGGLSLGLQSSRATSGAPLPQACLLTPSPRLQAAPTSPKASTSESGVSITALISVTPLPLLSRVAKTTQHRLFKKIRLFIVLDANIVFELHCSVEYSWWKLAFQQWSMKGRLWMAQA